ncbi:PTS sugar transporter subunit IIA [Clostridiaceae bacterium]|nr:PTS sugar transporter subunit IIA [Clostridiaceae bacterium]RKJ81942.1 PTS sugar transporter subunit IIA [Butyricicoccus sp. 1XD8-22]
MVVLETENIILDCTADSCEAVIRTAVERLTENGYTDPQYADAVIERERAYPTGLPTEEVVTALPHANSSCVKKTGVCVVRLQSPVAFGNMGDPDEKLPAELVFLLANASGAAAHLDDLQELMGCFSRKGLLRDLKNAANAAQFQQIFASWEQYPEA